MTIRAFPPVHEADEHGLLAVGGDLEVDSLRLAYSSGIFPWPWTEEFLAWFAPPERCVMFLENFHAARSFRKFLRQTPFECRINHGFREIIKNCAASSHRPGQNGTWITPEIQDAYFELHLAGYAHCIGCFDGTRLVGGTYGVSIGGMFAGESMFFLEPNASKMSLWHLSEFLKQQNVTWFDCQVANPFSQSLGATEISRDDYMKLLAVALKAPAIQWPRPQL